MTGEAVSQEQKIHRPTRIYAAICLLSALFGVVLSFYAQRGGITPPNAFFAPILDPWSQVLPPNAHGVSVWSIEYTAFAGCLTCVLAFSLLGSYFAGRRWLRYVSTGVAILALITWVLSGLAKVILEMA